MVVLGSMKREVNGSRLWDSILHLQIILTQPTREVIRCSVITDLLGASGATFASYNAGPDFGLLESINNEPTNLMLSHRGLNS